MLLDMFENVVVGIGGNDEAGDDAIALAKQLVSPRGRLTLVHVLVVAAKPAPDSGSFQTAAKHRRAVEELTDLAQQLAPAARVSCLEAPSVRRGLHEFASTRQADLLVVGASHNDELAQLLLGDDTGEVLDDPPCPVAVAPVGYVCRATTIQRIGVAYDGSTESERAVVLARRWATGRDAELSAFQVVSAPLYPRDVWDVRGEIDRHVEDARRQVAALGGIDAEAEFGDPADELIRYASSVDLLSSAPTGTGRVTD
jgi:nucleotide-binding universal stress UspA family protein